MDERQCRICFDTDGELVTPCRCRGTHAYIHPECLRVYFLYYPDGLCRVCRTSMKRFPPDELSYAIGGLVWMFALSYAWGLPPDQRFVYLALTAGVIAYYFALHSMFILVGVCTMALSGAFLLFPYDSAFQLLVIASISFTGAALCMYVPVHALMITMALILASLYSTFLILYALSYGTPLSASILSCFVIFIWTFIVRARPPQGIV